jgi:tetratricopeptide (TPR) repeat protein
LPLVSSIFLVLSLVLAVTLGPQTRAWSWGPSLAALVISLSFALPLIWKRGFIKLERSILVIGGLTAAWFALRAATSPVAEFGSSDLLLLSATVGCFIVTRAIGGHRHAELALNWGMALLLLASIAVVDKQVADPTYAPIFSQRAADAMVSGFYAHYNEAANYFIAAALLVGGIGLFGTQKRIVRLLFGLIAIAGIACVWYTRSRGGIFGAALGCATLAAMGLIIGKRRNSKWFAPALIAIPLIGFAVATYWFVGWEEAQRFRTEGKFGIDSLLDNTCRLYFYGIALSCIGLHPLFGGGSWSFSWECFRFWDNSVQGIGVNRPELVHNELLQSATDYGIIGTILLLTLLTALSLSAIIRTCLDDEPHASDHRWAWRAGGIAALVGMLVQSSFSFVFHHLPGVILLGICLGQMAYPVQGNCKFESRIGKSFLSLTALACLIFTAPLAWLGIRVTKELWPIYCNKHEAISTDRRIDALGKAIRIWPHSEMHMDRARLLHELAGSTRGEESIHWARMALSDYQAAARIHPHDPAFVVNQGIIFSVLGETANAETAFLKSIELQGGMEAGFRSHQAYASHLARKGHSQLESGDKISALATLQDAANQIERAHVLSAAYVMGAEGRSLRVNIHELLGLAHEANRNESQALECYNFAASLPMGNRAHHRAGVLIGRMARDTWHQRKPAQALALFIEARERMAKAGADLPYGATATRRAELMKYFEESIRFLKAAKVVPKK